MEYFDVLDCAGRKTGQTISREEAHRTGAWHGAFHCLIIYEQAGRGYALFQKRSGKKRTAPGRFDVSVGGHYAAGENARIAGPREMKEELGIDVAFEDLVPLGRRVSLYCFESGVRECEFQDVFLLIREMRPESLTMQTEEVDSVLKVEIEQGIDLFSGRISFVECPLYKTGAPEEQVRVSADDFVPSLDRYYLKLLLLARRSFSGERDHLVSGERDHLVSGERDHLVI